MCNVSNERYAYEATKTLNILQIGNPMSEQLAIKFCVTQICLFYVLLNVYKQT